MILEHDDGDGFAGRVTLDQIFRRVAERRPDAMALVGPRDPWGRRLRLTFAETDRAVEALAARLAGLGLPTDSIVAVQGATEPGLLVALLAIGRAGLVPMLLPELWRDIDVVPALRDSGARAVVSLGDPAVAELHCRAAAEVFAVRFVAAVADTAADGVIALGSVPALAVAEAAAVQMAPRAGNPAEHVAVLTWDVGSDGPFLVPRSHRALVAGGFPVLVESRLDDGSVLVDTIGAASFPGLAAAVVPWLLTGARLVLEGPAEPDPLAATLADEQATHLLLPSEVAAAFAVERRLAEHLQCLLLLDRSPEQVPSTLPDGFQAVDIGCFGELAVVVRRRFGGPRRAAVPTRAAAGRGEDPVAAGVHGHRTLQGTLALSGAMVPKAAFPAPAGARLPLVADGAVDTGWTCHAEPAGDTLVCDAPPRGIARVGGYRFGLRDLEARLADRTGAAVELAALPHRLLGQRIVAAIDGDNPLTDQDVSPLVTVSARAAARRSGT